MILTCYLNGLPAWHELVPVDVVLPDAHDDCTYSLEPRK